ncbi:MAG: DUF4188 domain-containing protein [Ilumatobacteraceae bacterium]|nr:DUF4188 domain-containing protein [Acidimicrobiales bacterium]MCB9394706.1 DUF4188 domain-containing protein [Acidimicrobiaceae bacterium]
MASLVHPGRFTADVAAALDDDADEFVVFVIGMRINQLWKVPKWLPVARSMGPMVAELMQHPEKGLLGFESSFGRTTTMIQYWRSFDQLEHFAHDRDDPHLQAWRDFNTKVGSSGDVGVYHETYRVKVADYECVYVNMPAMGLAKATAHVPIARKGDAARDRITAAARVSG